jgi:hypothetical protein
MAGVWTYPIPIIVIVALAAALSARGGPPSMELDPAPCTSCETPMSQRRVSILESLTLRGVLSALIAVVELNQAKVCRRPLREEICEFKLCLLSLL